MQLIGAAKERACKGESMQRREHAAHIGACNRESILGPAYWTSILEHAKERACSL
jgi:hypothetical protein